MLYKSFGLKDSITQLKKKLTINFFFTLLIFMLFSCFLYFKNRSFDIVFLLCELILVIALFIIQYSQIVVKGLTLNKTVTSIQIEKNIIIFETAPFNVLFWINKPAEVLNFKIEEIRITRMQYNVKEIYNLDNYVFNITCNKQSVLLICDYFESELLIKLKEEVNF